MIPKEILDFYVDAVVCACEVSKEKLLSNCRVEDVVDARYILIQLLYEAGAYPSMIASAIGMTSRAVLYALGKFEGRRKGKKWLRNNYEKAKKQLGNNQLP